MAESPVSADDVRARIDRFKADYASVRDQVGRVIVGHDDVVDQVLTCLFAGGHVLLEGVPGLGKTLLVRSLSEALSLSFSRIQFTPDLMPADVTGTTILVESDEEAGSGGKSREFRFQQGPVFAQILLADEINRATPKTQSALLEAMQERSVTVGRETHRLPSPFLVMATQNPLEQEGTYPLPEAQLDRFFFKLVVGYSSRQEMGEILERTTRSEAPTIEPVLDEARILEHQALVRAVEAPAHVADYAVRMVLATHPKGESSSGEFATPMVNKYVRVGASPRAAQAMVLAAKCRAIAAGRAAAAVDDIRAVALPALRHRLITNFEAAADAISTDAIVRNIVDTLPIDVELPKVAG